MTWKLRAAFVIAIVPLGCATVRLYEDDRSAENRGWFTVESAEGGAFFGNLSGYLANPDVRAGGVSSEFWLRAEGFCRGRVERLSDRVCVAEPRFTWDASAAYGQCKMDFFRCAGTV